MFLFALFGQFRFSRDTCTCTGTLIRSILLSARLLIYTCKCTRYMLHVLQNTLSNCDKSLLTCLQFDFIKESGERFAWWTFEKNKWKSSRKTLLQQRIVTLRKRHAYKLDVSLSYIALLLTPTITNHDHGTHFRYM